MRTACERLLVLATAALVYGGCSAVPQSSNLIPYTSSGGQGDAGETSGAGQGGVEEANEPINSLQRQVLAESTFDADAQGWTVGGSTAPVGEVTWQPQGGHPGGYALHWGGTGEPGAIWYWSAPAEFLGDRRAAYGGLLTFDLSTNIPEGATTDPILLLASRPGSAGTAVVLAMQTLTPAVVGAGWLAYGVRLSTAVSWVDQATGQLATQSELEAVLSDLGSIQIRGGEFDEEALTPARGGLDSVALTGP
jgi:hypothetical protein